MRKYKCPICKDVSYINKPAVYSHMERVHEDVIPKGMYAAEYYYQLTTGKTGHCVICKKPTKWNPTTNKYNRFCGNPKCKQKYREIFKKRMIKKYGKVTLTDDPEQQKKMLANRKISGKYTWSDKSKVFTYTGTYELDFLKYIDLVLSFESSDVMAPSPHTFSYVYEGKDHFWIPDFFIPSLNLEIEIKASDNRHPKIVAVDNKKEALKDDVMKSQHDFNYIKIYDKKYKEFTQLIETLRNEDDDADVIIICKAPYGVTANTNNLVATNETVIYEGDVIADNPTLSKVSVGSIKFFDDEQIILINGGKQTGLLINMQKDNSKLNNLLQNNERVNIINPVINIIKKPDDDRVKDFYKKYPDLKEDQEKLLMHYFTFLREYCGEQIVDKTNLLNNYWIEGLPILAIYDNFAATLEGSTCLLALRDDCYLYMKYRILKEEENDSISLQDIIHYLIFYEYDKSYKDDSVSEPNQNNLAFTKDDSEDDE